ncbi:MAG: hypothetical protein ISS15_15480 [Alphaproteobacteria bacterium]|nr:hypothetical protein [Alphaproteobacteria bacterium]MBL6937722.1 hypothetical protein [Alphaproteobacteria bacterium]MBL7099060.1 hypothetical protein [Alphaproteobacteria bacterium]
MIYSAEGYEERARECVTLANLARDELVQRELLKLRQTYLNIANRLRKTDAVELRN